MVAQERAPLPVVRDLRCVGENVDDRSRSLLAQRVEEPRHRREVEAHLALRRLQSAEVVDDLGRRLVGLGQQDPTRILGIDHGSQVGDERVRLREVLAVGSLLLEEVGDRVEPEPVDAEIHPEPHDVEHLLLHPRILEVEVRLV